MLDRAKELNIYVSAVAEAALNNAVASGRACDASAMSRVRVSESVAQSMF